jgi:hypothetical protein
MSFYCNPKSEFMKRRIQLINSEGVLRIRELRNLARVLFPCVSARQQVQYDDYMSSAQQIVYNLHFLLDMFDVDPLP